MSVGQSSAVFKQALHPKLAREVYAAKLVQIASRRVPANRQRLSARLGAASSLDEHSGCATREPHPACYTHACDTWTS